MNLDGISCKNNLHTKKYIVKGFIEGNSGEKLSYLLENAHGEKYFLNIDLSPTVKLFNLFDADEFYIFDKFGFVAEKFYKPLGYLEAFFFMDRTNRPVFKLKSAMFEITEKNMKLSFEFIDKDRFFELSKDKFLEHINDKVWVPDEAIVHDGKMHADDILFASLLRFCNPNIKITRTRNIPENFKGIVGDTGRGRYDHHDLNKYRIDPKTEKPYMLSTGEPELYSAFGLLAKDVLPGFVGLKSFYTIDHQIIRSLDNNDNYGTFSDLAYFFSLFNPVWDDSRTPDEPFEHAVDLGVIFIREIVSHELARQRAVPYLQSKLSKVKDHILVLEHRVPWQTAAKKSSVYFAIFPTDDGKFALQCASTINSTARDKINKIDLPEEWFEYPPPGMEFLHSSLYLATFDTETNAYAAAKDAIIKGKRNI